ncbi:redoxin domain-containing protein [Botrimarina sp.]|uniref:TlpA family protein disulfide reductase n=1 Tax=Botrimarina sp. TaxID=2795802 RepID=UPI0032EDF7BF
MRPADSNRYLLIAVAAVAPAATALAQTGPRALAELRARERAQQQAQLAASAAATGGPVNIDADQVELPADPRLWTNSPPLSMAALDGKGVVFYFFEEQCAACAEQWPMLNAMAAKHQGEPVLFVAVNSGTDPRELGRYVSRNRVQWRLVHDPNGSLANAMGVPALTPQGPYFAVRSLNGEGEIESGVGTDFEATVKQALEGAAWRVAPQGIPRELMRAWESIEFGDFASAARAVNRAASSNEEGVKSAAERLQTAVSEHATELAKQAKDALDEGDKWAAYKALNRIVEQFSDYEDLPLVDRVETKRDELAEDAEIERQVEAANLLEKAIATAARGGPAAMRRGKSQLERIVSDHGGTEAADRAQKLLNSQSR